MNPACERAWNNHVVPDEESGSVLFLNNPVGVSGFFSFLKRKKGPKDAGVMATESKKAEVKAAEKKMRKEADIQAAIMSAGKAYYKWALENNIPVKPDAMVDRGGTDLSPTFLYGYWTQLLSRNDRDEAEAAAKKAAKSKGAFYQLGSPDEDDYYPIVFTNDPQAIITHLSKNPLRVPGAIRPAESYLDFDPGARDREGSAGVGDLRTLLLPGLSTGRGSRDTESLIKRLQKAESKLAKYEAKGKRRFTSYWQKKVDGLKAQIQEAQQRMGRYAGTSDSWDESGWVDYYGIAETVGNLVQAVNAVCADDDDDSAEGLVVVGEMTMPTFWWLKRGAARIEALDQKLEEAKAKLAEAEQGEQTQVNQAKIVGLKGKIAKLEKRIVKSAGRVQKRAVKQESKAAKAESKLASQPTVAAVGWVDYYNDEREVAGLEAMVGAISTAVDDLDDAGFVAELMYDKALRGERWGSFGVGAANPQAGVAVSAARRDYVIGLTEGGVEYKQLPNGAIQVLGDVAQISQAYHYAQMTADAFGVKAAVNPKTNTVTFIAVSSSDGVGGSWSDRKRLHPQINAARKEFKTWMETTGKPYATRKGEGGLKAAYRVHAHQGVVRKARAIASKHNLDIRVKAGSDGTYVVEFVPFYMSGAVGRGRRMARMSLSRPMPTLQAQTTTQSALSSNPKYGQPGGKAAFRLHQQHKEYKEQLEAQRAQQSQYGEQQYGGEDYYGGYQGGGSQDGSYPETEEVIILEQGPLVPIGQMPSNMPVMRRQVMPAMAQPLPYPASYPFYPYV